MTWSQLLLTRLRVGLRCFIGYGLICLSLSAHALTLAGIEVQSHKGEPLRAEISVSSATAEEWGQLVVRLAPAERFAQLGLVFTPAVGQLQVELLETTDGNKRIRLFSPQAFSENFVDLLIEAQTPSGKWVKAFTLMLKPAPVKVDAPIKLPEAASALLETHRLRILAKPLGIAKIDSSTDATVIQFDAQPNVDAGKIILMIQKEKDMKLAGAERLRITRSFPKVSDRVQFLKGLIKQLV